MSAILEDIVFQHAEDASALWHRRRLAVREPHYSLSDLSELDSRINANIKGLLVAGADAEALMDELVEAQDDGALFTAGLVAVESGQHHRFHALLQRETESQQNKLDQLASALAWVKPGLLAGIVKKLLETDDSTQAIIGLRACAAHRKLTENIVNPYLQTVDAQLRTVAAQVTANSALKRLLPVLASNREAASDSREQFEHLRALALLGDRGSALAQLPALVMEDTDVANSALALYLQIAGVGEGKALLKQLDGIAGRERDVVSGFGIIGDPVAIPWLIGKMHDPLLNRVAGESISMITGLDIVDTNLDLEDVPEGGEETGPNDDPEDENVALDPDEDLAWCDPSAMNQWWNANASFVAGQRYLAGYPRTVEGLTNVLQHGLQRQRKIAATSLVITQSQSPFVDTELPVARQLEVMAKC